MSSQKLNVVLVACPLALLVGGLIGLWARTAEEKKEEAKYELVEKVQEWYTEEGTEVYFMRGEKVKYVVCHGAKDSTEVCWSGVHCDPSYIIQKGLWAGQLKEGDKVVVVCCHPNSKRPGEYRGVKYEFFGPQHKGLTYSSSGKNGRLLARGTEEQPK